MADPRCGSNAGWWVHYRRKELPCTPCGTAGPGPVTVNSRVRRAAIRRLIDAHRRQYEGLLAEEHVRSAREEARGA